MKRNEKKEKRRIFRFSYSTGIVNGIVIFFEVRGLQTAGDLPSRKRPQKTGSGPVWGTPGKKNIFGFFFVRRANFSVLPKLSRKE